MKFIFSLILSLFFTYSSYSQDVELDSISKIQDLSGEWKFIPDDSSFFSSPEFDDSNWQLISLPGLWKKQESVNIKTAWYRKQIYINEEWIGKVISIQSPSFIDAHELYFNGVKIGEEGKIDFEGNCVINNSRKNVSSIPESVIRINALNTIAVRVCNFSGFGGASGEMFIGESQKVKEKFYRSMVWNVSVGLVFLFVAIYHLILFLGSNKDYSYLYFSIASLLTSCLTLGYFQFTYWVFDSYWFHFYIFYSGFGTMILFIVLFLYSFFDYKVPTWIRLLNYSVLLNFVLFLISPLSSILLNFYLNFGQSYLMLTGIPYSISLFFLVVRAVKDKKKESKIIAGGLVFLLLAVVSGLLLYFNFINFIYLLPESFLIFLLTNVIALSTKFYNVNEQVILMEKKHSEELEIRIKERTKDLEEAKKTADIETGIAWIAQRESQVEKEKTEKLLKDIQKDMVTAQKIQQNILPHNIDKIQQFKIATMYKPVSSVGGDFYDIAEIKPGLVRAFIADATGHGVQAALITMAIKSEYESVKDVLNSPARVLKFLNENFANKYKSLDIYFTAFIIDIDIINNKITFSSAGHNPQILIDKNEIQLLSLRGNIIGMIPNVDYEEEVRNISSGRLFLFTDGVAEEFNLEQEQFGDERVIKILEEKKNEPIENTLETLYMEMLKFIDSARVRDDITVIGIDYSP